MTFNDLFPFQQKAQEDISALFRSGKRKVLAVSPGGSGKCLGINTPVLMYDGSIEMVQDIKYGDLLMGNDSLPRRILSTNVGFGKLYRVNPVKGDSYVVNEDHILSLRIGSGEDNINVQGVNYKANDIVNISIKEYFKSSKWFRTCAKGWRTGVEFYDQKDVELEIDPYFLGLWLGDGNSIRLCITTGSEDIKKYLIKFASENYLKVRVEPNSENSENYHLINEVYNGKLGELQNLFKDLNLFGNKYIPKRYKVSTIKNRYAILAGLLDSDGHLSANCFDFISKDQQISEDVCFISRSLGLSAYINKCKKHCYYKGEKKEDWYYRVCISGDTDLIPCKVERNKATKRKQSKNVLYTGIKSIDYIGLGNYYGFEITGNRLFLLGDFTVTHNTVMSASTTSSYHIKQYQKETQKKVAFFTHREELFNQTRDKFLRFNNITEPIDANTNHINPHSDTFVVMVETFDRRSDSDSFLEYFKNVGLVFIDEAHRTDFNKILHHFDQSMIQGWTATPISTDKKEPLNKVWDCMIEVATVSQLQRLNQQDPSVGVVPSDCYQLKGIDRGALKKKGEDFNERLMSNDFRDKKQVANVIEKYLELGKGMKGLLFGVDIDHIEVLHKELLSIGVPSRMLHSDKKRFLGAPNAAMAKNWRKDTIKWLNETPGAIIPNVGILTTGFDEPSVELVMTAYSTLSISKFIQCIVRGARPYKYPNGEWKEAYRLMDFGMNCEYFSTDGNNDIPWQKYFDMPSSSRNREGVGGYKTCPSCSNLVPSSTRFCRGLKQNWITQEMEECGHQFPITEKEEDLVPRVMVKYFNDGINVIDLVALSKINGQKIGSVYFQIMNQVSALSKRHFGTYLLKEQFEFVLDIAFKKLKELAKESGKRTWRDSVKEKLIPKLREDGMIIDVEEMQ